MRVILCNQGEIARPVEINNELVEFQSIVGGLIESAPLVNGALIVCNEEGKLRDDLLPNRFVTLGGSLNVIYGNFFVCGFDGSDFKSLPHKLEPVVSALLSKPDFDKKGKRIM